LQSVSTRASDQAVEYALLGPFEARSADGPLRLGAPKSRALLALLALNANLVVSRERLIDSLWGEEPPGTAVKGIQVYVSRLRKVLPAGRLQSHSCGYLLHVEPELVDVLRFEQLLEEAHGAPPALSSPLLASALELWRGPPLAEFATEPFAQLESRRLADLRLTVYEERIQADLALGRHHVLIAELERLVAEHPHREKLRAQLMLALYRAGRQVDALAAYRSAQAALAELGIEPGPLLRGLERQVLTQDRELDLRPSRPLTGAPNGRVHLPGALISASPFPFVGRSQELALARGLLERAAAGEGAVLLLAGDAGRGKTRIVQELAREAAASGALVLYGSSDAAVTVPYQPVREWLEFALRACEHEALRACLGPPGASLGGLSAEIAVLAGARTEGEAVEPDRFALQAAVTDVLRRMSEVQPLVVVLDDLHWADAETLLLLRRLARCAPELRVLVVGAFRRRSDEGSGMLEDALGDLERLNGVTRMTLENLSSDELTEFIRTVHAEPSAELVAAVREMTSGTPLLVCELWRDLSRGGTLAADDAQLTRAVKELRGPERLRDVVRQRLARMAPAAAGAVEIAAVAGRQFELGVLAEAAALEGSALVQAVECAIHNGLFEELPESVGSCRFTHELVRRAIYDRITVIRRAELHLRVGEALERVYRLEPDRVLAELAHHFTLAVPVDGRARAAAYNLRLADAGMAAAAYDDAVEKLRIALALGIADAEERARAQIDLGYLLGETGHVSDAEAVLVESLNAASSLAERGIAADALMNRLGARLADPLLDLEVQQRGFEQVIETFEQLGDERGLALARRHLAVTLTRLGRHRAAVRELRSALAHASASGDRTARRRVMATLAHNLSMDQTPVADAISECRELLEAASPDRALAAVISRFLALLLAMRGDPDEALARLAQSDVVLDALGQITNSGVYGWAGFETRRLLGDLAGAERQQRATWQLFCGSGSRGIDERAMGAAYRLGWFLCDLGRWDEASELAAFASDVPEPPQPTLTALYRLGLAGRLAARHGDLARAIELGQRVVATAEVRGNPNFKALAWGGLAEIFRKAGRSTEADLALGTALSHYESKGNVAAAAAVAAAVNGGSAR
jgi:DNA-binding SARP family transcriptional activator